MLTKAGGEKLKTNIRTKKPGEKERAARRITNGPQAIFILAKTAEITNYMQINKLIDINSH